MSYLKTIFNLSAHLWIFHYDKIPRLHKPNARRMMGRIEQPCYNLFRNSIRQKLPSDVTTTVNHLVKGLSFRFTDGHIHNTLFCDEKRNSIKK